MGAPSRFPNSSPDLCLKRRQGSSLSGLSTALVLRLSGVDDFRRSPDVIQCWGHKVGRLLRADFRVTHDFLGFTAKGSLG